VRPIFSHKSRRNPQAPDEHLVSALGFAGGSDEAAEPPPDTRSIIARTREQAIQAVDEIACGLSADVRQADPRFLEWYWQQLGYHFNVAQTAAVAARQARTPSPHHSPANDPAVPEYLISSRFLKECFAYLTADSQGFERLHLVTGIALDGRRCVLSEMQKVAMSAQSERGAKADTQAFTKALIELSTCGHALHGLFHSHPGASPSSTHPSPIDVTTHTRLEAGDIPLIGAIFVKGYGGNHGYVRFFTAANRPFTVTMYGTGVTALKGDTHVYNIEIHPTPRRVSYETISGC
jgi:hypothetical protein